MKAIKLIFKKNQKVRQKPVSHPTLTVHQVPIDDVESTDIISHFESTNAFISNVLLIKKERVLVHCVAGVSRSTTLVAAYLMTLKSGIAAEKVVRFIKSKREQAEPSSSFMSQLEIWERTGCEWNPAKWSEQRRFLMDNMAAQVRGKQQLHWRSTSI
jgi:dual specificity phosphatase 12